MDTAAAIVIGVIVGYVAMMFIVRAVQTNATAENLAKFLVVILAGTAVKFALSQVSDGDDGMYSEYAIGLGIGFGTYVILYFLTWLLTRDSNNPPHPGPFPTRNT